MVKVSKLAQRKLIPHRSIIGLGAFQKIKYFGDIPDSYCAYRDLTLKSKLFKNMFLLSCFKMTHETSQSGRSPLSYGILNFAKDVKKMLIRPCQQFGVFSRSNISATIHPINIVPRSFWTSFVSSFRWLHLIRNVK